MEETGQSSPDDSLSEARIESLRAELAVATDRATKALVHYELGHALEEGGDTGAALIEYEHARKSDSSFRLPLFALLRLHRAQGDTAKLADLFATLAKVAKEPGDEISALIDHAELLEDTLGREKQARALYERVLSRQPENLTASLMLERTLRRAGDHRGAAKVVATRAEHERDPVEKRVLLLELAAGREAEGDIDGAVELLRGPSSGKDLQVRFLRELARLGRRHGLVHDRIEVMERLARIAERRAKGESVSQGLSGGALPPFADEDEARGVATSVLRGIAQLKLTEDDVRGALAALDRAVGLAPEDALLRYERLNLYERLDDFGNAQKDARTLTADAGPPAAAIHLRIADLSARKSNRRARRAALEAAAAADPSSAIAAALLEEELLTNAEPADRITWLTNSARDLPPNDKQRLLWRAARIAAYQLRSEQRTRNLYLEAASAGPNESAVLRDCWGAALHLGDNSLASDATARLLERDDLDPAERSAFLYERYRQLRAAGGDAERATRLLADLRDDDDAPAWVAHVLRLASAERRDLRGLAAAHIALSRRARARGETEGGGAHAAAAGRALGRVGDFEAATEVLRGALEHAPSDEYVRTLLEEVLRQRGAVGELAALLSAAGDAETDARSAEPLLLRAAYTAAEAGDTERALSACRRAAAKSPDSVAPRWAMWRIAHDEGNPEHIAEAVEALAQRELSSGRASVATLALGEARALGGEAGDHGIKELLAVLEHDSAGAAAAATMLLTMQDPGMRARAIDRLLEEAHGPAASALRRILGGMLLEGLGAPEKVREIARRILAASREDRWALWAALRSTFADAKQAKQRSEAFERLGTVTTDATTGAELLLYALYSSPDDDDDDERRRRLVEEIESHDPGSLLAAVAQETVATPASAADALSARLGHAPTASRGAVGAAMGRALVLSGRHGEGLRVLLEATGDDDDDLSAWEALRVAAIAEQAHDALVEADRHLINQAPMAQRAALLYEAGVCLAERLARPEEAEVLLRQALELTPSDGSLYAALHEILADRSDAPALLALVTERIAVTDDSDELSRLFFEQAELAVETGDAARTIDALKNLRVLSPDHAPGLALLAATHEELGEHEASVDALRSLACVDLPFEERRDARLAAARALMEELSDPASAYQELKVVENMGAGEEGLFSRMALLAEQAQMHEEAVEALSAAAALTEGPTRARYETRAAVIHRVVRGDEAAARDAYRRALEAVPTDLPAASALSDLLDRAGKRRLSASFDSAVRTQMAAEGTSAEALRKLRQAAQWAEDRDYERLVLEALLVLGEATDEEIGACEGLSAVTATNPRGMPSDESLRAIGARGLGGPIAEMLNLATEAVRVVDGADLKDLGVGRRELLKPKDPSAVRDEVESIGALFHVDADRFYLGGQPAGGAALIGSRLEPAAWVVNEALEAPLEPTTRFRLGTLAMAHHEGALPLLSRNVGDGINLVAAIAIAADQRLAGADSDDGQAAALRKTLSRSARKSIERLAGETDIESIREHCASVRRTCLRAGLAVAGDLRASLAMVTGGVPNFERIASSKDAIDLFTFWLSPEHRALRAEMGFEVSDVERGEEDLEQAAQRLERASGFFGVRSSEDAGWTARASDLLDRVGSADPREPSLVTGTHPQLAPATLPTHEERLALLTSLAGATSDTRLLVSAAEIAEASGDENRARELTARAGEGDGDDVVRLVRSRGAALRRGAFSEVAELLEAEARVAASPDERGLALALLAIVSLCRLGDLPRARDAAARALSNRPKSVAVALLAAVLAPRNDPDASANALERAARGWEDEKGRAALLVEAARQKERSGDLTRARFLYKRAAAEDADALDATVGLARTAFQQRGYDEAAEALVRAAELLNDRHLSEAFLRAAGRMLHVAADKASHAVTILGDVSDSPAVEALAIAAEAARDGDALRRAVTACAAATRRTARALWLVRLAELSSEEGDQRGAMRALRDAAHADQTLDLIRVVSEAIARRAGDLRELARVAQSTGLSALSASARIALDATARSYELKLLSDAAASDEPAPAALVAATDAAAESGVQDGDAAHREAEHLPSADGAARLLAIADAAERRGDPRECARLLREVRRVDPTELIALRRLAALIMERAPQKAAALWHQEGDARRGDGAAFAHLIAAQLMDDEAAASARARAHDASPGYAPALWAIEERARRDGNPEKLRALVLARAEDIPDPKAAAEAMIRAAFTAREPDAELLARAGRLIPEDVALGDVRLRLGGLSAKERAEVFENASIGTSKAFARAMLIRAAEALEEAGEPGRAADLLGGIASDGDAGMDPIAKEIRQRCLLAAGHFDEARELLGEAVVSAADDISRALANERIADFELRVREDTARAAEAYGEILTQYPSHIGSIRAIERIAMERADDPALADVEAKLTRLASAADAAAHARVAVRLLRLLGQQPSQEGSGNDDAIAEILRHTFDYGEVDLWLAREIEALARASGDGRLQTQAWAEMSDLLEEPRERMAAEKRLAEVTARVRSPNAAQSRLSRALSIDLKYPSVGETLGQLRRTAGDPVGAAEAFEDGSRRAKAPAGKARLALLAGSLYEGAGDPERAAKAYFAAAKADPKGGDVLSRLMRLLPAHGQAKALADLLTARLAMGGDKDTLKEIHLMLARVKRGLGDPAAAKKSLRTVITLDPTAVDALEELARLCLETADPRGAAEALQKLVITSHDYEVIRRSYISLAAVHEGQRDVRRTKEVLRKMLELFPDDTEAKQKLAMLEAR